MEWANQLSRVAASCGITASEAANAVPQMAEAMRAAITDDQVAALIQMNPTMTRIQKRRLIRKLQRKA